MILLFFVSFSLQSAETIDLGTLEIIGESRRPNVNFVDIDRGVKQARDNVTKRTILDFDKEWSYLDKTNSKQSADHINKVNHIKRELLQFEKSILENN